MRKLTALVVLVCTCHLLSAQNNFHKLYRAPDQLTSIAMTTATNGDAIMATMHGSGANARVVFIRVDSSANTVWTRAFQPPVLEKVPVSMEATPDNGAVVAMVDTAQMMSFQLLKITSLGSVAWAKSFAGQYFLPLPPAIHVLPDGSIYLAHADDASFMLKKFDAAGTLQWQKTYTRPGTGVRIPSAVVHYGNAVYIGGYNVDSYTSFLMKTDLSGNIEWQYYNIGALSSLLNLATTPGGNVILSTVSETSDTKVASISPSGNTNWTYGLALPQPRMTRTAANAITILANDQGLMKAAVIDTLGNIVSSRSYLDSVASNIFALSAIPGRGFWASGPGDSLLLLIKADLAGNSDCKTQSITLTPQPYSFTPVVVNFTATATSPVLTDLAFIPASVSFATSDACGLTTPVRLVSFKATAEGKTVKLKWVAENESDFSHYEVERSIDGMSYSSLDKIRASGAGQYQYIDNAPARRGKVYYRLKMVDHDGRFLYSPVASVNMSTADNLLIYPNPVRDKVTIEQSADRPYEFATITDQAGKVVFTRSLLSVTHINTSVLTKGVYILKLTNAEGATYIKKIVKQ